MVYQRKNTALLGLLLSTLQTVKACLTNCHVNMPKKDEFCVSKIEYTSSENIENFDFIWRYFSASCEKVHSQLLTSISQCNATFFGDVKQESSTATTFLGNQNSMKSVCDLQQPQALGMFLYKHGVEASIQEKWGKLATCLNSQAEIQEFCAQYEEFNSRYVNIMIGTFVGVCALSCLFTIAACAYGCVVSYREKNEATPLNPQLTTRYGGV
jgi:hypothetical protein